LNDLFLKMTKKVFKKKIGEEWKVEIINGDKRQSDSSAIRLYSIRESADYLGRVVGAVREVIKMSFSHITFMLIFADESA